MKLKISFFLYFYLILVLHVFAIDYEIVANGNVVSDGDQIEDCVGLAVSYSVTPSTGIVGYKWNLGESSTSESPTAGTIYDAVGTYTVSVTLTLDDGTTQTIQHANLIEVKDSPEVDLVLSKNIVCKDEVILFSHTEDLGVYADIKYIINGAVYRPNQGEFLEYVANQTGIFDVVLDVSLPSGCSNQSREVLEVKELFTVDFTSNGKAVTEVVTCAESKTLTFNAETSRVIADPTYEWYVNGVLIPNSDVKDFTYTFYDTPETSYTVELGVYDGECYKVSNVKKVITFIDFDDAFTVTQLREDCNTITYQFTPKADLLGQTGSFRWDFGNGTQDVSSLNTIQRAYTKTNVEQTFTVSLTNKNDDTCSYSDEVLVPKAEEGYFELNEYSFCSIPATVNIINFSPSDLTNFEWRVTGGSFPNYPNDKSPSFTFNNYGTYTIQLLDEWGCVLHEQRVTVQELQVSISGNKRACLEDEGDTKNMSFTANVNNGSGNYKYTWHKKDLYRNTTETVEKVNDPITDFDFTWGDFELELHVEDLDKGCEETVTVNVKVRVRPIVDFTLDKTEVCNGDEVTGTPTLQNFSSEYEAFLVAVGDEVLFSWDFNDDGAFGDGNPYTYENEAPREIDVCLSSRYRSGGYCSARQVCKPLEILPPEALFSVSIPDLCEPTLLEIINESDEGTQVGNIEYTWTIVVTELDGTKITHVYVTDDTDENPLQNISYPPLPSGHIPVGATVEITLDALLKPDGCTDTYTETIQIPIVPTVVAIEDHEKACLGDNLNYKAILENHEGKNVSLQWKFTHSDGTEIIRYGENIYFNANKLGKYTVELIFQYEDCDPIIYPVSPLKVQGIIFSIQANDSFCMGEIPSDENVLVSVEDIYPADAQVTYTWLTNNNIVETGNATGSTIPEIAYSDLGLQVFDDQSQENTIRLELDIVDGVDVLCATSQSRNIHLTDPEPLAFDVNEEAYSLQYDYNCVSEAIEVKIRIGHDLNKGSGRNEHVLENYTVSWEYKLKDSSDDYQSIEPLNNYNKNKLSIFNLLTGVYLMKMIVTDANGCVDFIEFEIEMPEIIDAVADFEQDKILTCPGILTLSDLETNVKHSTPSMFVFTNGDTLKSEIIERAWDFGDGTQAPHPSENVQEIPHYFENNGVGYYEVNLTIKERYPNGNTSCSTISDNRIVSIDGVEGGFDADRRIIHKEQSVILNSYLGDGFKSVDVTYNWASGDGYLSGYGDYTSIQLTYLREREEAYIPALLLNSQGCVSEAESDVEILVLPCPELPINDTTFCVSDELNTITAHDVAYDKYLDVTDNFGNTLESKVHYQWFIDGVLVGEEQEITFEDGRDGNPLTIDPDNEEGIDLTLKVWVSSVYNGTVETDVICLEEKTINVKYQHSPYPLITEGENCTALALQANIFNFNYLDEEYTDDVIYEWAINNVQGGTLTSGTVLTNSLLALDAASFDENSVKIDVDLSLKTSSTKTLICPQIVNTSYSIYRKPTIFLQKNIEGCENEVLTVLPTAEEITDGYVWEWTELETTGGELVLEELVYGEANFTELSYDTESYRIVSSWELKVSNKYSSECYSTDTVEVIFNKLPELVFTPLESCDGWKGKFHTKNYEGSINYVWTNPIGTETGGNLASYEDVQLNDSTILSLEVSSFDDNAIFIDVPLQFDTYLISDTGHECIVSKDTTVRMYRYPKVDIVDVIEGCENEVLTVLPTAEEITDGYVWEWRELETTGGELVLEELAYGEANFTELTYDVESYRIVSSWELKVSNKYSSECYSTDTVEVIFNKLPELVFTPLESCDGWKGQFHAKNYEGSINYVWTNPIGTETGGNLASYEDVQLNDSTILSLEISSFADNAIFIDVPLQFDTYLISDTGHECIVSKDTTVRMYRYPKVDIVDVIEGCEHEVLTVSPVAEEITDGYVWEWAELETTGGSLNHTISKEEITFDTPIFNENSFHVYSTWQLRVANSESESCYTLDTVNVVFNRIPNAEFTFSRNPVCIGEVVELSVGNSIVPTTGVLYHWDTDADGIYELTSLGDTSVVYTSDGFKSIKMYIETDYGCPSEVYDDILDVKPIPVADFSVENVCIGESSEFINKSSISDNTELRYKWYFDATSDVISSEEETPIFTFDRVGEHLVKLLIESPTGCIDSISYTTTIHPLPELKVSDDIYICYGESVEIEASNALTYLWSTKQTTAKITVNPVADSTFYVSGFSEYGCETKDSVKVYVIPPIADTELFKEACEGDIITLDARIEEYEGVDQWYEWSTGENTAQIDVKTNGKYSVVTHVKHESGVECDFTIEYEAKFHLNPAESFDDEIIHCFETGPIELTATAGDNFIYYWEDTGETTRTVYRNAPNTFTVVMIDETYETRCETIEEFTVLDICPPRAIAPNAFTPNNDRLNDTFFIKMAYALNIEISIYNRWGEIVFNAKYPTVDEANEEENGWDGTYKGSPSEPGVYYYTLRYESELERGTFLEKAGSLTLIR